MESQCFMSAMETEILINFPFMFPFLKYIHGHTVHAEKDKNNLFPLLNNLIYSVYRYEEQTQWKRERHDGASVWIKEMLNM